MTDDNFNEREDRDAWEAGAYERDVLADELEHVEREAVDRLRRDWPMSPPKEAA